VAFDFEVAGLLAVFGAGFELERVLAAAQGKRASAVDVKMAAELGRVGEIQFDGPTARVFEVHPCGDGLAGFAVDDFDFQLAVGAGRGVDRRA